MYLANTESLLHRIRRFEDARFLRLCERQLTDQILIFFLNSFYCLSIRDVFKNEIVASEMYKACRLGHTLAAVMVLSWNIFTFPTSDVVIITFCLRRIHAEPRLVESQISLDFLGGSYRSKWIYGTRKAFETFEWCLEKICVRFLGIFRVFVEYLTV